MNYFRWFLFLQVKRKVKSSGKELFTMSTIGERLKLVRGKRSGDEFAESLGIHHQTLYRYERGERTPDINFIQLVSEKEKISLDWLASGNGSMHISAHQDNSQDEPQNRSSLIERLEVKLERVEQQRDELIEENRQLWKENGDLRERCARLEGQGALDACLPFKKLPNTQPSDRANS